jgi:hypothetical protein
MRTMVLGLALLCLQISGAAAVELTGTLKRVSETGQINLGFREFEPPMSFQAQDGSPVGEASISCAVLPLKRLVDLSVSVSHSLRL